MCKTFISVSTLFTDFGIFVFPFLKSTFKTSVQLYCFYLKLIIKYSAPANQAKYNSQQNIQPKPLLSLHQRSQDESWVYCEDSIMKIQVAESPAAGLCIQTINSLTRTEYLKAFCIFHVAILLCQNLISLSGQNTCSCLRSHWLWLYNVLLQMYNIWGLFAQNVTRLVKDQGINAYIKCFNQILENPLMLIFC